MKFEHAQNTLKYKVGDVVVLAENVDQNDEQTFIPGALVEIKVIPDDEHYTVALKNDPSDIWWVTDDEINHEATALLQTSNKSGYLVQKISVENDVVSSAVSESTPNNTEEKKMKFKLGDKVKYVGTGWDDSFSRDVVYPVTEVWASGGGCDIDKTPVSSCFYRDFELVEEHQLKSQDNSWYESGKLPPVNTKCIFTGVDVAVEGVILAHVEFKGQYSAIIQCDGDWWTGELGEFLPWYSDEQIAAQEREKVIDAISDLLIETERMSRYTDVAAHLYDAGLRFVEEE